MEHAHNTSKAASEVLVGLLLEGTNLNFVAYKSSVRIVSADGQKQWKLVEKAVLTIWKELADRVALHRL